MNSKFPAEILEKISTSGVVAVLVIDDVDHAVPVAKALLDGGIGIMELTLRTPAAIDALKAIRDQVPEMLAGIGTILKLEQVHEVVAAGASFGVSPGTNPQIVREAQKVGLPFAPGVVTPTDVEIALELGCRELKFFPAEPSGGLAYLKSMAAPFAHLGVSFVPLGGVNSNNMADYLSDPLILGVGGSWLAPRDLIAAEQWSSITERAAAARNTADQVRKESSK